MSCFVLVSFSTRSSRFPLRYMSIDSCCCLDIFRRMAMHFSSGSLSPDPAFGKNNNGKLSCESMRGHHQHGERVRKRHRRSIKASNPCHLHTRYSLYPLLPNPTNLTQTVTNSIPSSYCSSYLRRTPLLANVGYANAERAIHGIATTCHTTDNFMS